VLQQFIIDHQNDDVAQLALQRNRYPMLSDSDFRFCLQQIDGRQRTRDKLPTFARIDGWLYPPRLNLEQCSSERTARFKASLVKAVSNQQSAVRLIDGTGGFGVDTFFMSEFAAETHYFEQNTDLAAIADHNFRLAGKSIHCHAEPFSLSSLSVSGLLSLSDGVPTTNRQWGAGSGLLLFLDPARRDNHGGKVFRLEDCTPNVIDIIRKIREIRTEQQIRILLKLSPMLDFHQAIAQLGGSWDVYIVSVNNEVKELLLLSEGTGQIHAVMLTDSGNHIFSFTPDEESTAEVQTISNAQLKQYQTCSSNTQFIFEPDAALLKAGAFRLISARYGLMKAAPNTHLYFSNQLSTLKREVQTRSSNAQLSTLPGRWWQVLGVYTRTKEVQRACTRANILTRNYVLSADALRKQLRLKDGGDDYIIGCRIADKPLLLHCRVCR
jgi:hypothetical protein